LSGRCFGLPNAHGFLVWLNVQPFGLAPHRLLSIGPDSQRTIFGLITQKRM
jgi:hypothetical protein